MTTIHNPQFDQQFAGLKKRHEDFLSNCLATHTHPAPQLIAAMRYATFNGGKRLRPLIVYAVGLSFSTNLAKLDQAAAAVELIHCYSLIHDDLPAMDDDDFRRGLPSCHKQFDEATAILAGDALQSLAFHLLAKPHQSLLAQQQLDMIQQLSLAIGDRGMAGGQMIDIQISQDHNQNFDIKTVHRLKTGALLTASVELGAIAAQCPIKQYHLLQEFGQAIGLGFQLQDDLLDNTSDNNSMGNTYLNSHSTTSTQHTIDKLYKESLKSLQQLPHDTTLLAYLARIMLYRQA